MNPQESRWGSALRLSSLVLGFATSVLLARVLGAESFGTYSYALSWLLLGASFVQAGLPGLLLRESATRQMQERPDSASGLLGFGLVTATLGSALVTLALGLGAAVGLFGESSRQVLFVGLPSLMFSGWIAVSETMTRSTGAVVRGQLEQVLRPLVQIACLIPLVLGFFPRTPLCAMVAFAVSSGVTALVTDRVRHGQVPITNPFQGFSRHAEKLRGLFLMSGIGWLGACSLQAGTILLGLFADDVEVAQYRVALQIGLLGSTGVTVAYATHLPAINAALKAGDRALGQDLARASSRFSLGFGLLIVVPLLLGGKPLFGWIFGSQYEEAWLTSVILVGGQLVHASTGVVAGVLYAEHGEFTVLGSQAVFLCLRVIATIVVIPHWGTEGAALAAACETAILHAFLVVAARRRTGIWSLPIKAS